MNLPSESTVDTSSGMQVSSRREALITGGAAVLLGVVAGQLPLTRVVEAFSLLQVTEPVPNPLAAYPNRDWERVYRDLYRPDSTFHYLCAPNDTHGCLLKASVKNGVAVRCDPSFGYKNATDIYGNTASARWDPRACVSGLGYVRRAYSDRRVKGCYVRNGFKKWIDDGFPRGSDGQPPL
ncbi:MAG: molybdopterin oxidoreductase, partial [Actinomycetota bacterium]